MTIRGARGGPAWRVWALAIAATVTIATAAGLVMLTRRNAMAPPAETTSKPSDPHSDRLYVSGFDYAAYDGADPVFRVQARELIHRKRKFGPFTLNPVKEVELRGARVELFPPRRPRGDPGAAAAGAPPSLDLILQGALASKNLGFVSRVVLRDLEVDDRRSGDLSHLSAREAIWRPGEERLEVRGPFEIRDRSGVRSGRDASLSWDQGTTWKMSVASPR